MGEGLLGGMRVFKYTRALFGLSVSAVIAIVVTFLTKPEPQERQGGLVWGTVAEALKRYKGSPGEESESRSALGTVARMEEERISEGEGRLPLVRLSRGLAEAIEAKEGDLLYVEDTRGWLGGLRSGHAVVGEIFEAGAKSIVELGPDTYAAVVAPHRTERDFRIERLY